MKRIYLTIFSFLLALTFLPAQNITHANVPNLTDPVQIGKASWYSEQSPGINKHTANMEIFDDSGLTAAMWDVPFHQRVKVTNLDNGRFVIVRINDRGPHRRFVKEGRIIDLTKEAFSTIAPLGRGLIDIRLDIL